MRKRSDKIMDVVEEAIIYATEKHCGQVRKMSNIPYILHPLEVANIIATITTDKDVIAAGILHDTIEDCNADPREIREKFGIRVSALVQSETEDKISNKPAAETWMERKEDSLLFLSHTKDIGVKTLWLADKLSNLRSFYREFEKHGNTIWNALHQKDPKMQCWYYETIAKYTKELSQTNAYKEFIFLISKLFHEEE